MTQTLHFGCSLAPLSCLPSTCTPQHKKCDILLRFLCWPASLTPTPHLPSTENPSLFHLLYLFYVVYVISFNLKINNFSVIPVDSGHSLIPVPFQWNSCNFCKFRSHSTGMTGFLQESVVHQKVLLFYYIPVTLLTVSSLSQHPQPSLTSKCKTEGLGAQ